jgi:alanyl-tRNA synthetase
MKLSGRFSATMWHRRVPTSPLNACDSTSSHPQPMTAEEKAEVEEIVNRKISENLPVSMKQMTLQEARELNARALFEGKYDEQVKVYEIGDFSREVCGGPHVESIGELGRFKIQKEQSSSRGVRRIRAVLT